MMKTWMMIAPLFAFAVAEMAIANEAPSLPSQVVNPVTTETPPAAAVSQAFISDGKPMVLPELGADITPPIGWEVQANTAGMSVVMQEPKAPTVDPATLKEPVTSFRRNITVTSLKEPVAIDETAAQIWKVKLKEMMEKNGAIKGLAISEEHKLFDYRKKNDGLVIYAGYLLNDVPMMQVNVLVSGAKNAFLMTYLDTAASFQANQAIFNAAWASMVSIDVSGEAPWRYAPYAKAGAGVGGLIFLLAVAAFFRWRASRRLIKGFDSHETMDQDDSEFGGSDEMAMMSGVAPRKNKAPRRTPAPKKKKAARAEESDMMPLSQAEAIKSYSDDEGIKSYVGDEVVSGVWQLDAKQDEAEVSNF